jgi:hypothetical protein
VRRSPRRINPAGNRRDYQAVADGDRAAELQRCVDVDCNAYLHGWRTYVDESTPLGQRQAYYIRYHSGRRYSEDRAPDGRTVFSFRSGQRCFKKHRPPLYLVTAGGDARRHSRGVDWLEDFHEHTDSIIKP